MKSSHLGPNDRFSTDRSCLGISAFDLDRTLIQTNSSFSFCKYLIRKCILPISSLFSALFYEIQHRFFDLSLTDLHYHLFKKILQGRSLDSLAVHVKPFLKESLSQFFYPPALSRLKEAKAQGHYTVLLSSSPSFIVGPIAEFLKVDEWKASVYGVDKEGKLSQIISLIQGEEKGQYLSQLSHQLGIEKEAIAAYSDSFLDLPFLLSAGVAIAVNPDRKLRRFSSENQWQII
jgi:HAD superfamily hydrolase (TIGR01490 family)